VLSGSCIVKGCGGCAHDPTRGGMFPSTHLGVWIIRGWCRRTCLGPSCTGHGGPVGNAAPSSLVTGRSRTDTLHVLAGATCMQMMKACCTPCRRPSSVPAAGGRQLSRGCEREGWRVPTSPWQMASLLDRRGHARLLAAHLIFSSLAMGGPKTHHKGATPPSAPDGPLVWAASVARERPPRRRVGQQSGSGPGSYPIPNEMGIRSGPSTLLLSARCSER
jgi:hypothetical protein